VQKIYLVYRGKASFVAVPTSNLQDRDNFGELSNVSTESKLDTSYVNEINSANFNTGTTSTSTIWKTSAIAMSELASSSLTTVQQIKDLFTNASTTNLSKDAKLYYAYKKIKDTKNISLSRLTLEEMWKISLDQQLLQGATVATTTTTYPVALPSVLYYKMNGAVGSSDKKKDEVRGDKPVYTETSVGTGNGRVNNTNGAYTFSGTTNYIKYPSSIATLGTNPYTISYWIKTPQTSWGTTFSITANGTRNGIQSAVLNGKIFTAVYWLNNGSYMGLEPVGIKNIADNQWHKIDTVIQNSPNAKVTVYIDGEKDYEVSGTVAYNIQNLTNEVTSGSYLQWSGYTIYPNSYYNGSLDDVKAYNTALTPDEVRREYQLDTNTITPAITQAVIDNSSSLDAYNRDKYNELNYVSPISSLKYAYDLQTGVITQDLPESILDTLLGNNGILPTPTLDSTTTSSTTLYTITPETLTLLNPGNYPFSVTSPTEISLQMNGVSYIVNLENYASFYENLNANNIDNLAKYLNKINTATEEITYTKFYPSSYYEYDSRGYVTINVPFNGKVVATVKYSTDNSNPLAETSYAVNNYQGTPVLITDVNASTTEVIQTDAWGVQVANNFSSTKQVPTDIGLTGHKLNYSNGLIYAHARSLNPLNKVWLSQDPMSINGFSSEYFLMNPQFQNSHSYGGNNPVNNVDPDGKVVIIINGTQFFGKYTGAGRNWTSPNLMNVIKSDPNFSGQAVGYFNWDADDNNNARLKGANEFSAFVENTMKMYPGEDLNIVAHSHGGQIAAMYSQKDDAHQIRNLVTMETPVVGYKFNESKIDNHIQTYGGRMTDWVQSFGGTQLNMGYLMGGIILGAGGINSIVPASALFSSGVGQFGIAGLKVEGAKNVDISAGLNTGLLDNHSQAHESAEIWRCYISNALLSPTKN
jgi:RHS repeat-associated protein